MCDTHGENFVHVTYPGIEDQPLVPRSAVPMMPGWSIVGEDQPQALVAAESATPEPAAAPVDEPEPEPAKQFRSRKKES